MEDIRDSISKIKKKFKHRLTGRKRKPDGTEADPGGERADSTTALLQRESHIVADESYDREGDRANAAEEQAFSTSRPPQPDGPKFVPTRGSGNGQEEGGTDVDGGEASQGYSHARPDVKVAVGSGRSGELEGVYTSLSTPPISYGGKADST